MPLRSGQSFVFATRFKLMPGASTCLRSSELVPRLAGNESFSNARPSALGEKLLLFSDAFERLVVGLLVDEPSGIVIAFCPPVVLGIVDLAPVLHCSNAVIVSIGFVLCHDDLLLLTFSRLEKVYFVLLADSQITFEILISMPVLQV